MSGTQVQTLDDEKHAFRPHRQGIRDNPQDKAMRPVVSGKMFLPEYGRDVLLSHGNDVFLRCAQ